MFNDFARAFVAVSTKYGHEVEKSDFIEGTLLKMAGIKTIPIKCKISANQTTRNQRVNFDFAGITPEEADQFATYFKTTYGDYLAEYNPHCPSELMGHPTCFVHLDSDILVKKVLPDYEIRLQSVKIASDIHALHQKLMNKLNVDHNCEEFSHADRLSKAMLMLQVCCEEGKSIEEIENASFKLTTAKYGFYSEFGSKPELINWKKTFGAELKKIMTEIGSHIQNLNQQLASRSHDQGYTPRVKTLTA